MKKSTALIIILLFISGCSMLKLGYNNAHWLVTWRIDDYFDLTSDQEDFVEQRLQFHLVWHRNNELPRYSQIIDEMIGRAQKGISEDDYVWAITQLREAYSRSVNQLIPDAATFLGNLQPVQIEYYIEQTADRYEDHDDGPRRTEEEQKERRGKRVTEHMEEWFGALSEEQKQTVAGLSYTLPLRYQYFREDRLRRHNEFIALLKSDITEETLAEKLRIYFTEYDNGRSQEYKEATALFNSASAKMAVEISKILTAEQKEHAYEKVRGYQVDLIDLAAND